MRQSDKRKSRAVTHLVPSAAAVRPRAEVELPAPVLIRFSAKDFPVR